MGWNITVRSDAYKNLRNLQLKGGVAFILMNAWITQSTEGHENQYYKLSWSVYLLY